MAISHFAIYGLSGVGKTTFVETVCNELSFFQPRQTVTREKRVDYTPQNFEYVTHKAFKCLEHAGKFFISDCQGSNYYGYRKKWLKDGKRRSLLLYGLPEKLHRTIVLGGICILIVGDATKGLQLRNDPVN